MAGLNLLILQMSQMIRINWMVNQCAQISLVKLWVSLVRNCIQPPLSMTYVQCLDVQCLALTSLSL